MSKTQNIIKQINDHGLTLQRKEWIAFLEELSADIESLCDAAKSEQENEKSPEGNADDDDYEDAPTGRGLTSTNQLTRKTKRTKKR